MRVAVTQFATSSNSQENLVSCIRMINEAAACQPSLIVMPELCNTQFCNIPFSNTQSCYLKHNQAWHEALPADGEFLQAIAQQAKKHNCYIMLNVTLRRNGSPELASNKTDAANTSDLNANNDAKINSKISITSCLFSPLGKLIHQADKQTLTGHESDLFIRENIENEASTAVTTAIGKLGLLAGSDDENYTAARELALDGAQLLCSSISSFAFDQSNLHGPARACENNVFLVQANKVGSLIPVGYISPENFPNEYLEGVGHSQIVAPNGKVLAKLAHDEEGYTFADIDAADLAKCGINHKHRPDGTEVSKQLRPELYKKQILPVSNAPQHEVATAEEESNIPATANVAIFATYKSNEQAIEDVCFYIENNLSDIIQLPELFFIADKTITNNAEQLADIESLSNQLISQISAELRPFQYVCTSLVLEGKHQAVIISEQGIFATQQQLHFCQRYSWTTLGDNLNIIELPLEQGNIQVAMLTADDAHIPELVNLAALNNIQVLLVPFDIQEPCEVKYGLLSRAAENRICIVAATREKSFTDESSIDNTVNNNDNSSNKNHNKKKIKPQKSTGLIANLASNSTVLNQWQAGKFTGYINQALVKHQHGKITKAVIHPIAAYDKLIGF